MNRPQNDPKTYDASSSSIAFQELAPSQAHKIKNRNDLEAELFGPTESTSFAGIRENEGQAAEHGVYFDDTEYDYMQHIRDLNAGNANGESYFVEAATKKKKDGKGKGKMNLEDALKEASLQDEHSESGVSQSGVSRLLDDDLLSSKDLRKSTYQDQQDVPDALAGFQPDMDPRLREVLEALEDEAYVDEEEDFFGEIAKDRREISLDEFEEAGFQDSGDEAGWETDETEKPSKEYKSGIMPPPAFSHSADTVMEDGPDHGDGDWMKEFSKFKQADKAARKAQPQAPNSELQSSIITGTSMTGGRRKKRKGAMTSSTGYSMTSSSIFRTEGQTLLDARFDKIEEDYAEDEMDLDGEGASVLTGGSVASSRTPSLVQRSDFDSIMDEFLGGYSMSGRKKVKKGGYQSGMEQLDEVRKGLGPARVKSQKAGR